MGVVAEIIPPLFVLGVFVAVGIVAFRATDGAERAAERQQRRERATGGGHSPSGPDAQPPTTAQPPPR